MPRKRKAAKDPKETLQKVADFFHEHEEEFHRGVDYPELSKKLRRMAVRWARTQVPKGSKVNSKCELLTNGTMRIHLYCKPPLQVKAELTIQQEDKQ
jgi:hypothetical protein